MRAWLWIVGGIVLYWLFIYSAAHAEPLAARQFRNDLIREVHAQWGLSAPIAVFAGQIEQESGWRPDVCSAVACGLAQFTGPTAKWIASIDPALTGAKVFDPSWAIRALVAYDLRLYKSNASAYSTVDQWAFALSSYNGGLGNVRKDAALCLLPACKPNAWFRNVELRSTRSAAAFRENRSYVRSILGRRQFTYSTWGATQPCPLC